MFPSASLGWFWGFRPRQRLAIRRHARLWPGWLGESLIFLGSAIWLALALIYLCRCLIDPRAVRDEFRNNTQFSFISLLPAGGVLVSIGLHPYSLPLANGLMVAGSVGQLIFSAALCAVVARRVRVGGHDAGILPADGGR